jgi:voltage-gated potassium channel
VAIEIEEREALMRNPIEQRVESFRRGRPSVRNAAGVIVLTTGLVVVGAGVVMRVVDPKEYPNIGVGMWWSVQTVTMAGYGDVTPKDVVGRLVGAAVMLEGTAFIAIITALITSTFVAGATRDSEAATVSEGPSNLERIQRRLTSSSCSRHLATCRENKPEVRGSEV